jgi:hypothetical protein
MLTSEQPRGWAWLEATSQTALNQDDVCRSAATCFDTAQGQLVLRHLRRVFLDRRMASSCSDAELRHVEGQRSVVSHLLNLIQRGKDLPAKPTTLSV